jgi:hypothetical protein
MDSDEWWAFAKEVRENHPFCAYCRRADVKLNVHHIFYDWNRKLWEYEPDEVMVLCESCHKEMHEQLYAFRKHVFKKLTPQAFRVINGALAVAVEQYDPLVFAHALCEFVSNDHLVNNHANAWKP